MDDNPVSFSSFRRSDTSKAEKAILDVQVASVMVLNPEDIDFT
jgi:hypothetical protein